MHLQATMATVAIVSLNRDALCNRIAWQPLQSYRMATFAIVSHGNRKCTCKTPSIEIFFTNRWYRHRFLAIDGIGIASWQSWQSMASAASTAGCIGCNRWSSAASAAIGASLRLRDAPSPSARKPRLACGFTPWPSSQCARAPRPAWRLATGSRLPCGWPSLAHATRLHRPPRSPCCS